MKLSTVLFHLLRLLVTSSAVIIPYKVGGGADETFYLLCFICSASPAYSYTQSYTRRKKFDFGFRSREAEIYPKIDFSRLS